MRTDIFLRYFLDFASLYFAAIMCFVPVARIMKSHVAAIFRAFATITAVSLVSALVCTVFSLEGNCLLLPEAAVYLTLFYHCLKDRITIWKAMFVFFTSALLISVCVMLSVILNAAAEVDNTDAVSLASTSLICLACEAVVCAAYILLASRWVRWLVEEYHYERIWKVVWVIPLGFTLLYIMIIPSDPATILVNRVFQISIILAVISFGAFFFSIFLFYRIAREFVRNIQLERENRLLAIESRRYEQLRGYMERSRQQRHDFRQHIRVISGLAGSGRTEELRQYISRYETELGDERAMYCANAAVDAIAGYYDIAAKEKGVAVQWQLGLPQELSIAQADICMTIGNLVENAVTAVCALPQEQRRITVICRMLSPAMIGMVVENPYSGEINRCGDDILPDRTRDAGLGLASVKSVANKYRGKVMIETENNIFRVNVLLNL